MAQLRVDRSTLPSDTIYFADQLERIKVVNRQPSLGARFSARCSPTWDVQTASGGVGVDVVPATFSSDPGGLEHLIRTRLLRQPDWQGRSKLPGPEQSRIVAFEFSRNEYTHSAGGGAVPNQLAWLQARSGQA